MAALTSCENAVLYHLRPIHTRDFAPGVCSRGTLPEQSSSVCTNDFMGILHPREQNFHPAKCSTIFNRLNTWEQAPGAKRSLMCTDKCKMSQEHAPGAKPLVCIGLCRYHFVRSTLHIVYSHLKIILIYCLSRTVLSRLIISSEFYVIFHFIRKLEYNTGAPNDKFRKISVRKTI